MLPWLMFRLGWGYLTVNLQFGHPQALVWTFKEITIQHPGKLIKMITNITYGFKIQVTCNNYITLTVPNTNCSLQYPTPSVDPPSLSLLFSFSPAPPSQHHGSRPYTWSIRFNDVFTFYLFKKKWTFVQQYVFQIPGFQS